MDIPWQNILPMLGQGAIVTVQVTALSAIAALLFSLLLGLARLSRLRLIRMIALVFIELFRGFPLLVLLFWVYFSLPLAGLALPKLGAAVLAIGLNYGAFGAEIVRSAIQAVPKGQWEASTALNLRPVQRMLYVVLPQAGLRMLPPMGNLMIELLKATSLIYFITMSDLTYQALILRNNYLNLELYIFGLLLIVYFLLASVIAFIVRRLERKLAAGRV